MTVRDDATPLSLSDRFYLTLCAIDMVEQGIEAEKAEAIELGIDPDDDNLLDALEELRSHSLISLLHSMTNSQEEAKALVRMVRMEREKSQPDG